MLPGATRSLGGMLTLAGAICHTEPAGFLAIHLYVPVCVIRVFSITLLVWNGRLDSLGYKASGHVNNIPRMQF